jgi:hypothetical protein
LEELGKVCRFGPGTVEDKGSKNRSLELLTPFVGLVLTGRLGKASPFSLDGV